METTTKKLLRRLAWRSLCIPLFYVGVGYFFLLGMTALAHPTAVVLHALHKLGIVLFLVTILLWVVFRKRLMKSLLTSDLKELSRKATEKHQAILTVLKEDLADAADNSWSLALDKTRGNWKERYDQRDRQLALLYRQSADYSEKELRLATLFDYL